MKSRIFKNIAIILIIIIGSTVVFLGCGDTTAKNESISSNAKVKSEKLDLKEKQTKALEDLNKLSDKLVKAVDADSINSIIKEYYELNKGSILNVYFGQESGEFYIYPKATLPSGYDPRGRDWYTKAIKSETYISEPFKDISNGKSIVTFAKVVSKDNTNIGVIAIEKIGD